MSYAAKVHNSDQSEDDDYFQFEVLRENIFKKARDKIRMLLGSENYYKYIT